MKHLLLILAMTIPIVASAAPSGGPVPTLKPEEKGTHISLWVPGLLIKTAAKLVEGEDKQAAELLRNFGTTSIKVMEGASLDDAKYERKMDRIKRRMDRRNYKNLIEVQTPEETIRISYKDRWPGRGQKLVITVLEDDTFVYLKTRCKLSFQQLIQLASSYDT